MPSFGPLLGQLIGNPQGAEYFMKGTQIAALARAAQAHEVAQTFDMLMTNVRRNDQNRQADATLALHQQQLAETARVHDAQIGMYNAHAKLYGSQAAQGPPSLGQSGDLNAGAAVTGGELPQAGGDSAPNTFTPISTADQEALAGDALKMRDRLKEMTGGMSPMQVLDDPEADPAHREAALGVIQFENKAESLASGFGINPPAASLSQLAATKPNASGMSAALFPAGSGAEAQPPPRKSGDPFAWENIKEGGNGQKQVAADGRSAIIRRKSGGVMIEARQTLENGKVRDWGERVIMPDALSKAPMAVQLPADKVQAFDTVKYWLEKIYPKMDAKTSETNSQQAMAMHKIMLDLANDPEVQTKQRQMGEKDYPSMPGFKINAFHTDSKGALVPSYVRETDAERQGRKDTDATVRAAWSSYDKMQKAAAALEKSGSKEAPAMQAQADGLLRRVMQLDPAFAATQGAAAIPQDTPSKVSKLFKTLVPQ